MVMKGPRTPAGGAARDLRSISLTTNYVSLLALTLASLTSHALADVHYVDISSTNPVSPYTDWSTAATNIQDAIDAATDGDLVLVTDGFYQTGGRMVYGSLTNRVAVTKALALQSVHGPAATTIYGSQSYVRCVYLTNGAVLSGFTLTNGSPALYTSSDAEKDGGGVWSESTTAAISNCVIAGNISWRSGGGAYSGSLINCTLAANRAAGGGGAANGILNNCTLNNNTSYSGAGATSASLTNCVLFGNSAGASGGGATSGTLSGCVISNNYANNGAGTFGGYVENCILSSNLARSFGGAAYGGTLSNCTVIANRATNQGGGVYQATLNNCVVISNTAGQGGGVYQATLNSCSVSGNSANQGGGTASSSLTNCTLTANSASSYGGGAYDGIFQSCTFATNVAKWGGGVTGGTLINCTLLGNSAHIVDPYGGLSDGGGAYGCPPGAGCGGFPNCTLINCALIGNQSTSHDGTGSGGGTSGCYLFNCLVSGNYASQGGGVSESALTGCTLVNNTYGWGAGAESSTLNSCMVVSNRGYYGGGMLWSTANNSTLIGNSAYQGAGATLSTLNNCTVVFNSGNYGGGLSGGAANNCIIYWNTADEEEDGPNYIHDGLPEDPLTLNYCCTSPMPSSTNGVGNTTTEPIFRDVSAGDFRLELNSPCINAGCNAYVSSPTDADGNPRVRGGTVDIGAYEFQAPTSVISYDWLRKYGLTYDGSADYQDTDGDGMNNWQEWRAGTVPTDPLSVLRLSVSAPDTNGIGLTLTWRGATDRNYFLQRSTNLTDFATVSPDIPGQPGVTSFADTNGIGNGPYFYRVGVR
jgi:hypothetical protein